MSERIALLIESDGPGGAESVVLALACEYRSAGHLVFPVVHKGGPGWLTGRLEAAGFSVHQPALRRPLDLTAVLELAQWMRSCGITAVHAHEFTTCVYGSAAAKLTGVPSLLTMHGGTGYTYALRRRVALSIAARLSKCLVGVSADTADTLARSLWLRRDRVQVVLNGVKPREGDRKRGRLALGLRDEERLLLAVGNLYSVKGHDILVRAASLLRSHGDLPPWRIAIAGRGEQAEMLRRLILELELADCVTLLGLRDDVPDLLAASDLFVMPSRSEGLPMAILEAMFAGIPVVASRVGGIPDVLEQGDLGLLFESEDPNALAGAIHSALSNEKQARSRSKAARDRAVTSFSSRAMATSYLRLLGR